MSDYRDDNYANIDDIEYIFGDIDNYYEPVLTSLLFGGGYQRYHFRGDKLHNMSVKSYFEKIMPCLRMLIDENKVYEQKIQLDMGFIMIHISDKRRITHFSRSDNVICMPSSNTNEILEQLLTSLHNKFQDDLVLSQENSSFVYESVEECNIHFHKINLRRGASFIESPQWLRHKKANINPQNSNDTYCFMYAIAIALFHEALGKNPGRISKQLIEYANAFDWHDIDFPASYDDYVTFERLNDIVALNILYVPFNQINICPAYISARNFDKKHQVVLLKIADDTGKWNFLALPSNLDEDGYKRPKKSISRLLEGISSKSHDDFYCYGCLHSFRSKTALKNHVDLCKDNEFAKIELPNDENNFKKFKPGAKSLKMNTAIYADFELILFPCETNKNNKHVACGYSINIVDNHNNTSKQTYYHGVDAISNFCKEIRSIAYKKISFFKRQIIELTLEEQKGYDGARYCHICKKVFGDKKKHRKVRDHNHYTGKYRGAAHSICNLRYSTEKDIPVWFHNGSNYDFNLIIIS